MIRNDYLMRSIQQLSQAFGQILSGKDIESPEYTLDQIQTAIADVFNTLGHPLPDSRTGPD